MLTGLFANDVRSDHSERCLPGFPTIKLLY